MTGDQHDQPVGNPDYERGFADGVSQVGARLMGITAATFGLDHPVLERMLTAIGEFDGPLDAG